MESVPSTHAIARFKELMEGAASGKTYAITKHGKIRAIIAPPPRDAASTESQGHPKPSP
jgi:antitoxin (DNA-binding transcriptional repressor) of toxin-antitoxin stability system